ncbi:MAG: CofH family radical SAM protein [Epsilonproteobacteria bacterium]|nr:CofH family radical SAM protein [Campylobacterota bacterium]
MNVIEKVKNNERLSFDEAVALYDLDLFVLGELADERRKALHGKRTYFNINRHINPTNICKDTAAEVHFLSKEYGKSYDEIIDLMIEYGVDSMPGGGAEIFDEKVRDYICKGKVTSAQWLEIHRKWHERGMRSNATMLFGHVEERSHRIDHMMRIRDLQDSTGGFNCFIPLVYQTENNYLNVKEFITAHEILKTYAISRIVLDNVPNLKAYWVTSTVNLALVAQEFGANDLDGTIERESINSAAGAKSANGINLSEFVALIKNSGFEPIERDSLYNTIKAW